MRPLHQNTSSTADTYWLDFWNVDRWLNGVVFVLLFLGVIMVNSSSVYYSKMLTNNPFYFFFRHVLALIVGISAMLLFYRIPYRFWQGKSWLLYSLSLAVLFYLAFIHRGRWVYLGPFHFQGTDVLRLAMLLFLADSLSRKQHLMPDFKNGYFPHLVFVLIPAFLILLQPDFSSAVILVLICLTVIFLSPVRLRYLFYTALSALPLLVLVVVISPYRAARLQAFLHPEKHIQDAAYQINHSLISLGSGGLFGVGFGQSRQKMFYLPEAYTDFIFSIIGEEWGLIGTILVTGLFFLLIWRGIKIVRQSPDRFGFYLAAGITANFAWYALVNIMVAVNLLPPTGIPLPFISYGGTALVVNCALIGILLSIARNSRGTKSTVLVSYSWRRPSRSSYPKLRFDYR